MRSCLEVKNVEDLLKTLNENIEDLNKKLDNYNKEVFNAKEAAEYLRISYDSLLRYTRIGQIEFVPNGSSYIYKKEFLDNWLNKNRKWN